MPGRLWKQWAYFIVYFITWQYASQLWTNSILLVNTITGQNHNVIGFVSQSVIAFAECELILKWIMWCSPIPRKRTTPFHNRSIRILVIIIQIYIQWYFTCIVKGFIKKHNISIYAKSTCLQLKRTETTYMGLCLQFVCHRNERKIV